MSRITAATSRCPQHGHSHQSVSPAPSSGGRSGMSARLSSWAHACETATAARGSRGSWAMEGGQKGGCRCCAAKADATKSDNIASRPMNQNTVATKHVAHTRARRGASALSRTQMMEGGIRPIWEQTCLRRWSMASAMGRGKTLPFRPSSDAGSITCSMWTQSTPNARKSGWCT